METTTTSNGLGQYMQLANLTVVGALILVIVVCTIFLVTKGIPKAIQLLSEFVSDILDRHEQSQNAQRQQFIDALENQTASRTEAAKGGHDAAMRIADNLHDLTEEIRRGREQHMKESRIVTDREAPKNVPVFW